MKGRDIKTELLKLQKLVLYTQLAQDISFCLSFKLIQIQDFLTDETLHRV